MIESARPWPPVPLPNLHGKEGSTGSSQSEGFEKTLQIGYSVVCPDAVSASRGYETGTSSDARALAGTCDLFQGVVGAGDRQSEARNACKRRVDVGSAGAI